VYSLKLANSYVKKYTTPKYLHITESAFQQANIFLNANNYTGTVMHTLQKQRKNYTGTVMQSNEHTTKTAEVLLQLMQFL